MKIAIAGASGRMGRMLIEAVLNDADAQLVGALDRADSPFLGTPARSSAKTGVKLTADLDAVFAQADTLIDFTRPEGTMAHIEAALRHDVKLVIGTTGFTAEQKAELQAAAGKIGIVFAANMSVGVNVTLKLLEFAAKHFSHGYDIEIIEAHHRHKVDAPSGTALMMGEAVAGALGRSLDDCAVYGRHGVTGERDPSSIGFAAVRGGDIVGDHTVLFAGIGERIEVTQSSSRVSYAQRCARSTSCRRAAPACSHGTCSACADTTGNSDGDTHRRCPLPRKRRCDHACRRLCAAGDVRRQLVLPPHESLAIARRQGRARSPRSGARRRSTRASPRSPAPIASACSCRSPKPRAMRLTTTTRLLRARRARRTRAARVAARDAALAAAPRIRLLLASIGSTAPFVGLLGTVWGIYHALGSIAASGQAQIENVAGRSARR